MKLQKELAKLVEREWFDFGNGPELVVAVTRFDDQKTWVLTQDNEYNLNGATEAKSAPS